MLISNPDIINSCRVCRSPNQDGDYQCLFQATKGIELPQLSEAGILYENLLDISIDSVYHYPQFLCNSCDLQMKLFKKLKDKALKTLEYLQNLYKEEEIASETKSCIINEALASIEHYANDEGETINQNHFLKTTEQEEEQLSEITKEYQHVDLHVDNKSQEFMKTFQAEENFDILSSEGIETEEIYNQSQDVLETFQDEENFKGVTAQIRHEDQQQQQSDIINFDKNYEEVEQYDNNDTTSSTNFYQIKLESQNPCEMEKSDYVTEIYELMDDNSKTEQYIKTPERLEEFEEYDETKAVSSIAFSDIEYVVESIYSMESDNEDNVLELNTHKKRKTNSTKDKNTIEKASRREYICGPCNQEFSTSQAFKKHRTLVHDDKYPCSLCSKLLHSQSALYTHMKRHNSPHRFQCDLCQKTFSQKVHLQYHMNHHNNIRNFKCNVCDKAFLTKTDLNVHMRAHTGDRPYVCDICGKSYLMTEHLKAHALIHTQQVFECEVCQRQFSTHKTLRQHIVTIHAEEPRFKCDICLKSFRRKHHLEYHSRRHQKTINLLDNHYKLVDEHEVDNGGVSDDITDQAEFVDDPGYVALSDDVILM